MDKERSIQISSWAIEGHELGVISDETFKDLELLTAFYYKNYDYFDTAIHEASHELGGAEFGWKGKVSIHPEGSVKGVTRFSLPNHSDETLIFESAVISFCSLAGEELFGISHEGCAGDIGHVRRLSRIPGFEGLESNSRREASRVISGIGINRIRQRAWKHLADEIGV